MPSPFPGMNPYLEQSDAWEDFHHEFIARAREMLADKAGPNYAVKIETRLYIHELSAEERRYAGNADVSVSASPRVEASAAIAVAEPLTAPMKLSLPSTDIERYSWLEIRDQRNRRVVTAIELLSPTNKKPGPDRDDYLNKRALYFYGPAHFVEIDLRRGGTRPQPPALPPCDYYVLLSRIQERFDFGVWPIALRERLPVIPIPLALPDPDVRLDLQSVLDRTYDAAQYGNYIYADTPVPPLSPHDAAWAQQFIPRQPSQP